MRETVAAGYCPNFLSLSLWGFFFSFMFPLNFHLSFASHGSQVSLHASSQPGEALPAVREARGLLPQAAELCRGWQCPAGLGWAGQDVALCLMCSWPLPCTSRLGVCCHPVCVWGCGVCLFVGVNVLPPRWESALRGAGCSQAGISFLLTMFYGQTQLKTSCWTSIQKWKSITQLLLQALE